MTVQDLRKRGFKVYVQHRRMYEHGASIVGPFNYSEAQRLGLYSNELTACGGDTLVEIFRNGHLIGKGEAKCSWKDNFCRKTGMMLAIERALLDIAR